MPQCQKNSPSLQLCPGWWACQSPGFQGQGQLVPHPVGDNLVVGRLLHKSDGRRLFARIHTVKRSAFKEHLSAPEPVRRKGAFELTQQRGLAAARRPAQYGKRPALQGKRDVLKRTARLFRVAKREIAHSYTLHVLSSVRPPAHLSLPPLRALHAASFARSSAVGVRHSAK